MNEFELPYIPKRVVSLVPSITESLFDLGLGECVKGITDSCIYPAERLLGIPRVGNVHSARIEEILALQPDLVFANQEENDRKTVEDLIEGGVPVWVAFPKTCREVIDDLWKIAGVFQNEEAGLRIRSLENSLEWAELSKDEEHSNRYFCPIWQDFGGPVGWWMTFNQDTYCHDLLGLFGGKNVFAERQRRYPVEADLGPAIPEEAGDRDIRYPHVTIQEIQENCPEIILLPDEPYSFTKNDLIFFQEKFRGVAVKLIDGSLITWPGTRMGKAIEALSDVFDALSS